jgi:hypothetical protein
MIPGLIPVLDDFFQKIANPPTPTLDKFAKVAADIRQADQDEAAYWHRRELIDEARKADREALDGSDE